MAALHRPQVGGEPKMPSIPGVEHCISSDSFFDLEAQALSATPPKLCGRHMMRLYMTVTCALLLIKWPSHAHCC